MSKRLRLALSMEGMIDGKAYRELEYTFYGKIKDFAQLEQAFEKEEHEQWQIPLDTDGPLKLRIRLIDGRRPTMTTKIRRPGTHGAMEVDSDISMDAFLHLREGGVNGYKKTRYNFKVPGTDRKWEIDVFLTSTGDPHPWVKIDYEVGDPNESIPKLPIDFEQIIVEGGSKETLEERRFVRQLWDSEWSRLDAAPKFAESGKTDEE
jgi:hypothetical protein